MDITSILCLSYIAIFIVYMNKGHLYDKATPIIFLSFTTYATVSYNNDELFTYM